MGRHRSELSAGSRRYVTIRRRIVPSEILRRCPKLVVDVAREVPLWLRVPGDARVGRLGDELFAILADILEHKRDIGARDVPVSFQKRVGLPVEGAARRRMLETREIVVVAVDDNGRVLDAPCVEPVGRRSANGLGETERQETHARHESTDDG